MLAVSAGCSTNGDSQIMQELDNVEVLSASTKEGSGLGSTVYDFETVRAIDEEAGVVIYAYTTGNGGGIATVPISETNYSQ